MILISHIDQITCPAITIDSHTGQSARQMRRRLKSQAIARAVSLFEPLETRKMLSASMVGSTLFVDGTANNDSLTVYQDSGVTYANVNGQTSSFSGPVTEVYVDAYEGDDTIEIHAGTAKALVFAGAGNDIIHTGDGNDEIYGQEGNDTIASGAGNDYVDGGAGDDYIQGGDGNDLLYGDGYNAGANFGSDYVYGDGGDDTVIGGFGADVLQGNAGNDTLSYGERVGGATLYIFNNTNYQVTADQANRSGQFPTDGDGGYNDGAGDIVYADFESIRGSTYTPNVVYNYGGPVTVTGGNGQDFFSDANPSSQFIGGAGEDQRSLSGVLQTLPYDDVVSQANGSTIQAENFDEGGEGVSYHDNDPQNTWGAYRNTGVDIVGGGSGFVIGNFGSGEWMQYTINVPEDGVYALKVSYAVPYSVLSLNISYDGSAGVRTVFPATAGYGEYRTLATPGQFLTAGKHVLRVAAPDGAINVDSYILTTASPTVTLSVPDNNVAENAGTASFLVTRDGPTTQPHTVWYTLDGTANNGVDYQRLNMPGALPGFLTIPAGQSSASLTVEGRQDNLVEGTEAIHLTLQPTSNYVVGGGSAGTANLTDSTVAISGIVFYDADADGVRDVGEPTQPNALVYLDQNHNGVFDNNEIHTLSNSAGQYSFAGLSPATYRVREVTPSGYRLTIPTPGFYDVNLSGGTPATGKNFGNTLPALISGIVFSDANGNGKWDKTTGEGTLANWRVYIDDNNDGIWESNEKSALTNSSGAYTLSGLTVGTYILRVVQQKGFVPTMPVTGNYVVPVLAGQNITAKLFGEKRIA